MLQQLFFSGPKVTAVFVSGLPDLWRIYYHALYKDVIWDVLQHFFSCGQKVTTIFMREFSDSWHINYHALSTNKLLGCVTIFFLPVESYHDVCE